MELQVGHYYVDRQGIVWCVTSVSGQRLWPVSYSRWDNGKFIGKVCHADGTTFVVGHEREEPDDLIREATVEEVRALSAW